MIQALLDSFVARKMAVGVSALVYVGGREAFFGCAGKRTLADSAPFARDTILLMYSMTKVVTAAAVMTLVDQGVLSPGTPVSDFIPAYAHLRVMGPDGVAVPARETLTIRHLLTMTSGIPYPAGQDAVARAYGEAMRGCDPAALTTLEMARLIAQCPLCFEPGARWRYGLSADVLGGVIVAATGMQLSDYMRQAIFDKLGMRDTFFAVPAEKKQRVAGLYNVDASGAFTPRRSLFGFTGLENTRVEMGGAGLYSTLDDFMRFGEMLRRGGENVLSPAAVRELARNQLTPAQLATFGETGSGYGYGYLVRSLMAPEKNEQYQEGPGSFGWNGMGGTTLRVDPARERTVVFGIQRVPPEHGDFLPPLMQCIARSIP